jgi:hypothetical protein
MMCCVMPLLVPAGAPAYAPARPACLLCCAILLSCIASGSGIKEGRTLPKPLACHALLCCACCACCAMPAGTPAAAAPHPHPPALTEPPPAALCQLILLPQKAHIQSCLFQRGHHLLDGRFAGRGQLLGHPTEALDRRQSLKSRIQAAISTPFACLGLGSAPSITGNSWAALDGV